MAVIGYLRVSTGEQSVEAQRHSIEQIHKVETWFADEGVSGAVKALDRPEFSELFKFVRKGDTLIVPAVDRLGRDTIDVLHTVEALQANGIAKAKAEGKTLGREKTIDDTAVAIWRKENAASIQTTAEHFGISPASVKRACRAV